MILSLVHSGVAGLSASAGPAAWSLLLSLLLLTVCTSVLRRFSASVSSDEILTPGLISTLVLLDRSSEQVSRLDTLMAASPSPVPVL